MIKQAAALVLLFGAVLALLLWFFYSHDAGLSCAAGSAIMFLNLLSFYLTWKLVLAKRSMALTVLVIILKYSILGLIFWSLTTATWIQPLGFVLGISTLLLAILCMTALKSFARKG